MPFLKESENRETFFNRIALLYPPLDPRYQAIEKAYDDAKDAFRDILREDGERYFEHLRVVALILIVYLRVKNHVLIIAALLHDIVEDIEHWSIEKVRLRYGDEVALLVAWLTKPPKSSGLSKEARDKIYHDRFANAPREFFLVKMPDRWHNLSTLWACSDEKKKRKIEETKLYYLPYAEHELILLHELEEAIEELEKPEDIQS